MQENRGITTILGQYLRKQKSEFLGAYISKDNDKWYVLAYQKRYHFRYHLAYHMAYFPFGVALSILVKTRLY